MFAAASHVKCIGATTQESGPGRSGANEARVIRSACRCGRYAF